MPLTISNFSGDRSGVQSGNFDTYIQLPDSGTNVLVAGSVTGFDGSAVPITGSPLTMPAAPGSGSVFWNIQVDVGSGAATVQQSTGSDPAQINPASVVIFRQTLVPGSIDPAEAGDSTPDAW